MKSQYKRGEQHPETKLYYWGLVSRGRELWLTAEKLIKYKERCLARRRVYIARKKEESGYFDKKRPKIGTIDPETGLIYSHMHGINEVWLTPERFKEVKLKRLESERTRKAANPEKYKEKYREYAERNKDALREKSRLKMAKKRLENKDDFKKKELRKKNERAKVRIKEDPVFSMKMRILPSLNRAFKRKGLSKEGSSHTLLGCSWDELKKHIESQFQSGMNWENRGLWHIDHIIPLSSANTVDEMKLLCHYKNLQPLWAADNIKKGAKVNV